MVYNAKKSVDKFRYFNNNDSMRNNSLTNTGSQALSLRHSKAAIENLVLDVKIVGNKTIVTAPNSFKFKPRKYAVTSNFPKVISKYAKTNGYNLLSYDEVLVKPNGIVYAVKLQVPVRVLAPGRLEEIYTSLADGGTLFGSTTDEELQEIANTRGHIIQAGLGGKNNLQKAHLIWACAVQQVLGEYAYKGNYIPLAVVHKRAEYNYTTTPQEYAQHILATGTEEFVAKWTFTPPTPPPVKPKAKKKRVINLDKQETRLNLISRVLDLKDTDVVTDVFSGLELAVLLDTPKSHLEKALTDDNAKYLWELLVRHSYYLETEEDPGYWKVREFSFYGEDPTPNQGAIQIAQAAVQKLIFNHRKVVGQ